MDRWAEADLEDRVEADLRFHRNMCQPTGHKALLHQWTSMEGSTWMSIMFAGVDRAIKNMNAKRRYDIVEAIESGDGAKAAATVATGGDETVPTVFVGTAALVNPSAREVIDTVKAEFGSRATEFLGSQSESVRRPWWLRMIGRW